MARKAEKKPTKVTAVKVPGKTSESKKGKGSDKVRSRDKDRGRDQEEVSNLKGSKTAGIVAQEAPGPKASEKSESKPSKSSIKRPKAETSSVSSAVSKAAVEDLQLWNELKEKHAKEKPLNYSMSSQFPSGKPLVHKVLGWGFILTNNNDRLEVIFESGKKILISNYQQS